MMQLKQAVMHVWFCSYPVIHVGGLKLSKPKSGIWPLIEHSFQVNFCMRNKLKERKNKIVIFMKSFPWCEKDQWNIQSRLYNRVPKYICVQVICIILLCLSWTCSYTLCASGQLDTSKGENTGKFELLNVIFAQYFCHLGFETACS